MDVTLRLTDILIVCATILGPVLAVQAQRWIERARERHNRRVAIFRNLMATRATILSPMHIEAINAVPIEFYGQQKTLKDTVEKWKIYIDHLSQTGMDGALWVQKRIDLYVDLLETMATALDYRFTKVELKREVYYPVGQSTLEAEQAVIRKGFFKLFSGEGAIPLDIKSFPSDSTAVAKQLELWQSASDWLKGQTTVRVETKPE